MRIKDICSGVTDGSHNPPQGLENSDYLMLSSKNVFDDKITFDSPRYLSQIDFEQESKRTRIKSGDVLLTIVGTVGRAAVVGENMPQFTLQRSVAVLHPNVEICDSRYLMYALQANRNHIESRAKGVAQKGIYLKEVADIELQIPLLSEQTHRVKVLDKIAFVIKFHQKQLQKLDELVKARFVEMFGDLKTNPKGWPILSFPEFAEIDGNMTTDYERYADYPHIGIDSIEKGTGKLSGYRTVREDGVISGKYIFTPKHIIYSKIRPNLNKVALPDFYGLCSADAYPVLPNYKNCNRIFLATAMRSEYFLEYILQFSSRTNLPKVNRKEIAGFRMPLPPLSLQEQFATFVEQVDKSKVAVQKSLDEAQLLFDSLMQQYFG